MSTKKPKRKTTLKPRTRAELQAALDMQVHDNYLLKRETGLKIKDLEIEKEAAIRRGKQQLATYVAVHDSLRAENAKLRQESHDFSRMLEAVRQYQKDAAAKLRHYADLIDAK